MGRTPLFCAALQLPPIIHSRVQLKKMASIELSNSAMLRSVPTLARAPLVHRTVPPDDNFRVELEILVLHSIQGPRHTSATVRNRGTAHLTVHDSLSWVGFAGVPGARIKSPGPARDP